MDKELAEWASSNGRPDEREEDEWDDDLEDSDWLEYLGDDLEFLAEGAPDLVEVTVTKKPKCDFCDEVAEYDGKTTLGPWANMCATCYGQFGTGLGLGRGQKLVVKET